VTELPRDIGGWYTLNTLGEGGQSKVYLARSPARQVERKEKLDELAKALRAHDEAKMSDVVWSAVRPDDDSELGAMKVFKLRDAGSDGEEEAVNRLTQEVDILREGRSGLPQLLDFNLADRWMVTEYFAAKTLEYNHSKYRGNVLLALKAFLSLVKTVASLHAQGIIHRDIKPANVFVRTDDELVLGDFGIVFLPDQPLRLTRTGESVGPHDYMPPWADVGGRLGEVHPSFDIYMLGKLLWCMVSGRLRLQREWFERPENNLTVLFRDDPAMHMINDILKLCVVENEAQCQTSASTLGIIVFTYIRMLERGGQLLHTGIARPCHVCGHGHYQNSGYASTIPQIPKDRPVGMRLWVDGNSPTLPVYPFVCDSCGNVQFFTRPAPSGC
jgi:serine/threonine protein kinase